MCCPPTFQVARPTVWYLVKLQCLLLNFFFELAVKTAAEFLSAICPKLQAKRLRRIFPNNVYSSPIFLSMVLKLKPWCHELRRGGIFFQLIKPCSASITKPLPAHNSLWQNQPFSQTQNRINVMFQNIHPNSTGH